MSNYFPGLRQSTLQDLDPITTWEPYSFDGCNLPSTGVLCKFRDGNIDYFDPRKHLGIVQNIRFIESDDPKPSRKSTDDNDTYIDDLGGLVSTFGF